MFLPETYQLTLALMILSMLCWGSWANTLKLCPNYRFQLFYWDYSFGLLLASILLGLTAGSAGHTGPSFIAALVETSRERILWAFCGGVIFNIANLLMAKRGGHIDTPSLAKDRERSTSTSTVELTVRLSRSPDTNFGGQFCNWATLAEV